MAVNNTNHANFIPASYILGAKINKLDMIETLCQIDLFIQAGGFHQIITLNAEMLYAAQERPELLTLINGADLVDVYKRQACCLWGKSITLGISFGKRRK